MDRNAQIEFLSDCESRVRSYVSKWMDNPAVREALERRPEGVQENGPPAYESQRKTA